MAEVIHNLKLDTTYCDDVLSGAKSFELRKNDHNYHVGDLIRFIPWHNQHIVEHPISECLYLIKYILADERYLQPGYVAMTIKPIN